MKKFAAGVLLGLMLGGSAVTASEWYETEKQILARIDRNVGGLAVTLSRIEQIMQRNAPPVAPTVLPAEAPPPTAICLQPGRCCNSVGAVVPCPR